MGSLLLLPISLCTIFWNLALAALLVILVPIIHDIDQFDPGAFGIALSPFGLGAFFGSSPARRFADQIAPPIILLFGPGSSAIAAGGLMLIRPDMPVSPLYACFFLLGFGPSMWLIARDSVRQPVLPPAMLGRVNAVILTAIYGVRPLGALIGGVVAGQAGLQAGFAVVFGAFAISFAVPLLSGLRASRATNLLSSWGRHNRLDPSKRAIVEADIQSNAVTNSLVRTAADRPYFLALPCRRSASGTLHRGTPRSSEGPLWAALIWTWQCRPKSDHLAVCIDSPPLVAPLAADADVSRDAWSARGQTSGPSDND